MTPERMRQVEEIFHGARERPRVERVAFLAEACAGDSALMREVENLLAQSSVGAIDTPVGALVADFVGAPDSRLEPGYSVGPYRIERLLGVGGMGEVYRARDSKLGRDVAIKILPRAFTADRGRLARFEREARVLAALNHPHIAAIYGIEESDGLRALVLELVEGETLAEHVQRGPLSIADAIAVARQIAEALESAHEKGIIHRDLKPANVRITPNGVVKVLDFGLAKTAVADGVARHLSESSALAGTATREGVVLGTAAYMSPEQARGRAVDSRTDIWAFGCVLFEMLTGRAAFAKDTLTDTLAAIVDREPEWTSLPSSAPFEVRHLLRQCLDKDPKQRPGDLGIRIALERLVTTPKRRFRQPLRAAGPMALLLVLVAGSTGLFYLAKPTAPMTAALEYEQLTNFTDSAVAPSLSPDGRMVTFIRGGEAAFLSRGQVYVKLLPNGESVQLTSNDHRKFAPVFTPDGSKIAYTEADPPNLNTWTVPVLGGQPTRLLPNASALTWIADHRVLFSENKSVGSHMGIVTATESREDSRDIYMSPQQIAMAHYSYASPDRRWVLVVEMNGIHAFTLPCRLVPFDGRSDGRQVGPQGTCTSAAWSPDGKWMYFGAVVGGGMHLWRQKFPNGAPEQITFGPLEEEGIAVSPDGRSLVTSVGTRRSAIWLHDATGERAITSEGYAELPRISRDGTRVFYLLVRDWRLGRTWLPLSAELRSVDLASGRSETLLPGVSVVDYDVSPDDKEVAFARMERGGQSQIFVAALDGSTPPRRIARGDQVSFAAEDSLVFRSIEPETNILVRIKKDGTGREQLAPPIVYDKLDVSPDGKWVLVHSAGSRTREGNPLFAVPIRGGAPKTVCPRACQAGWSSDGSFFYVKFELLAENGRGKTLVLPVPAGKSLPDLPPSGIDGGAGGVGLRGARVIDDMSLSTGHDPSIFVFTKTDYQRNLYRVPLR